MPLHTKSKNNNGRNKKFLSSSSSAAAESMAALTGLGYLRYSAIFIQKHIRIFIAKRKITLIRYHISAATIQYWYRMQTNYINLKKWWKLEAEAEALMRSKYLKSIILIGYNVMKYHLKCKWSRLYEMKRKQKEIDETNAEANAIEEEKKMKHEEHEKHKKEKIEAEANKKLMEEEKEKIEAEAVAASAAAAAAAAKKKKSKGCTIM